MDLVLTNFLYRLFLTYIDFLKAGVIHGFERNFRSFLESCLTGICLSIIVDVTLQKELNVLEESCSDEITVCQLIVWNSLIISCGLKVE